MPLSYHSTIQSLRLPAIYRDIKNKVWSFSDSSGLISNFYKKFVVFAFTMFSILVACSPQQQTENTATQTATETETQEKLTQITATEKISEQDPDWSPDGTWMTYSGVKDGNEDIWIVPTAGGDPKRITADPARDFMPRWSPDGETLLFVSTRGTGQRNLWTISSNGDPNSLVQVTTDKHAVGDNLVNWSPDGTEIVYSAVLSDHQNVWVISAQGKNARQITDLPGTSWDPDWSSDGKSIAYNYAPKEMVNSTLWIASASGGKERSLYEGLPLDDELGTQWCPDWSPDGKWITYCGTLSDGPMTIFVVSASGGKPIPVYSGSGNGVGRPRWSPDGTRILFFPQMDTSVLSSYNLKTDIKKTVIPELTSGGAIVDWSPDSKWIAFIQGQELWLLPIDGGESQRVDIVGAYPLRWFAGLSWSPDGKTIAFNSDASGVREIWTIPIEGGEADRITIDTGHSIMDWSADGQTLVFNSQGNGNQDLWTVPSSGGMAEKLIDWPGHQWGPRWSPDGKYIAFISNSSPKGITSTGGQNSAWKIWIVSTKDGTAKELAEGMRPSWDASSEYIYFGKQGDIWKVSTSGSDAQLVYSTSGNETWPNVSPDGKTLLFTESPGTDLWTINVEHLLQ